MTSKKLKLLAISDTHLGEETSLLSFPRGLQHLWQTLVEDEGHKGFWEPIFGEGLKAGEKVEVEELVLVGDIPDRTLSSTSEISSSSHGFSMMLGSALDVKKAVYLPGNHDHSLWSDYRGANAVSDRGNGADTAIPNSAASTAPVITGLRGEPLVESGKPANERAHEILSIFFGYPRGWAWSSIQNMPEFIFAVANPVYATEIAGRTYAFAHGTHFRPELDSPLQERVLSLIDAVQLDHLVGLEFEEIPDLTQARSMKDLEELVTPFVDHLWPSSKNKPTSRSDEAWYLMTLLSERLGEGNEPTLSGEDGSTPYVSEVFTREALVRAPQDRIGRLTDENGEPIDGSLRRFEKYFHKHLKAHLEDGGLSHESMTFVYGDTHRGGFGELLAKDGGDKIRVYNCGSWVVEPKGQRPQPRHPSCHLFAVDERGEEYLLDIVFGEKVTIGEQTLLDLAGQDAEHRLEMVGRGVRVVGGALSFLRNHLGR